MGLDGVEIVMEVEETFDIAIEDSEAEKILMPGQLIELVLSKVGRTTHAACLTQRAFHILRASLMRQLGIERNQIRLDSLLDLFFSRATRKEHVRRILDDMGLQKEIEFVRPNWLHRLILAVIFFGAITIAVLLAWHPIHSPTVFISFLFGSPIASAVLFIVFFGWLAFFVTLPMRVEFRPSMKTVGHLSRWIVAHAPDLVKAPPGQWSREQVSENIRQIVVDALGCEKTYREDAHFVKELGLS